jgi:hypothetical protein
MSSLYGKSAVEIASSSVRKSKLTPVPGMNFKDFTPENIWAAKQNHPELIVRDLCAEYPYVDPDTVRQSLMARGVNKWLKVRRDLIAYKKQLRNRIGVLERETIPALKKKCTELYCREKDIKEGTKTFTDFILYQRAQTELIKVKFLKEHLTMIRNTLKDLCMTERWQVWEGKKLADMNTIVAKDKPKVKK